MPGKKAAAFSGSRLFLEPYIWIAALAAALAVRLWKGLSFSITRDEGWSLNFFVFTPVSNIISRFDPPNNHVVNTLMMKLMTTWSLSMDLIRAPALLAGAGYVFAVYFIARKLRSGTGLLFFLAAALQPFIIDYTAISRGYPFGMCFFYFGLLQIAGGLNDDQAGSRGRMSVGRLLGAGLLFMLASFSVYSFLLPSLAAVTVLAGGTLFAGRKIADTMKILLFTAGPLLAGVFLLYSGGLAELIFPGRGVPPGETVRHFFEVASFGTVGSPDKFESLYRTLKELTHQVILYLPRYTKNIFETPVTLLLLFLYPFAIRKVVRTGNGIAGLLVLIPAVSFTGAMLSKHLVGTLYPLPRHFLAVIPACLFAAIEGLDELGRICRPAVIRRAGGWALAALLVLSPVKSALNGGFYDFEIDAGFDRIMEELVEDAGGEEVSLLAIFDDWHFFLLDYLYMVEEMPNIRITGKISDADYFVQPVQKPHIAARLGTNHEHIYTTRWGRSSLYKIRKEELLLNHPDEY